MINIKEFGAVGDGNAVDTEAIQGAIDACNAKGGGSVYVPTGTYRCGTIVLKSNVNVTVCAGATIVGSGELEDYSDEIGMFVDAVGHTRGRCLIYAEDAENVTIRGEGTIDGNGSAFPQGSERHKERPFLVRFVGCKDVTVENITLKDSPAWVSHYLRCENVVIHGITIHSRVNENNDGIDVDSCRNVRISDCHIDTGDDAICLKATSVVPCKNIVVTNCTLTSGCGAIKLGTESIGDMQNIAISNCVIYDTGLCGIKLISMDGCHLENVTITNIVMDQVTGPMFIRLGDRGNVYDKSEKQRPAGTLRNVSISNIQANVAAEDKEHSGMMITGIPGHCLEQISFDNMRISFRGTGTAEDGMIRPAEMVSDYPEHNFFGVLPGWAAFIRHARKLSFNNVTFELQEDDGRPAIACVDTEDIVMNNVTPYDVQEDCCF